jgi:hypothetical protein
MERETPLEKDSHHGRSSHDLAMRSSHDLAILELVC